MWHTHPNMVPHQSTTDMGGMAKLVAGAGQNQRRALMLIYGRKAGQPKAGLYIYESGSRGQAEEVISVGGTEISLETVVV